MECFRFAVLLLSFAAARAAWIGCQTPTPVTAANPRIRRRRTAAFGLRAPSAVRDERREPSLSLGRTRDFHGKLARHSTREPKDARDAEPRQRGTSTAVPDFSATLDRRKAISSAAVAGVVLGSKLGTSSTTFAYTPDPDRLRESLYLISRVQEATVQQERFVSRTKLQEDLRRKMKLTLRLVEKNYLLLDQINYASAFVSPKDEIVTATQAGNEAVVALQSAIDFVADDLGTGPLTDEQREFLTDALTTTREQLFVFLKYMPSDKLEAARLRVEDENVKNRDEFDGDSDAGVYNPVKLPWK